MIGRDKGGTSTVKERVFNIDNTLPDDPVSASIPNLPRASQKKI
jgi:hypothetical protein